MDFHTLGGQQKQRKTKQNLKVDKIGEMLVSGALDDTKTIEKAGADIFAKSGPEKNFKKKLKIKMFSGCFLIFLPIPRGLIPKIP